MRRVRLFALLIGIIAITGACAAEDPALEAPEATEATADATPPAEEGIELAAAQFGVVDNEEFGEILATGDGKTLYVFLNDRDGKSNCADACAETWPPLLSGGEPEVGEGADEELVDTIEREDGTTQVTYNDRPLYLYAADEAAGETKGQGVGGNWYVVGADGEPVEE